MLFSDILFSDHNYHSVLNIDLQIEYMMFMLANDFWSSSEVLLSF